MTSHIFEDLTSCVLDFQANLVRVTYRKMMTDINLNNQVHDYMLRQIWQRSKLEETVDADGQVVKWRQLGFDDEDVVEQFGDVGVLGVECMVRIIDEDMRFSRHASYPGHAHIARSYASQSTATPNSTRCVLHRSLEIR